jgi:hypothetical protein
MSSKRAANGVLEPDPRLKKALKMAKDRGYTVIPPKAEWQKLSVEVEKSQMIAFRDVVQRRGMKLKYALAEAMAEYVGRWSKQKKG